MTYLMEMKSMMRFRGNLIPLMVGKGRIPHTNSFSSNSGRTQIVYRQLIVSTHAQAGIDTHTHKHTQSH